MQPIHAIGTEARRGTELGPDTANATPIVMALLHLASGGLNNAGLALELALLPPGASPERATLYMGIGGVHQAARALLMLRELVAPGSVNTSGTAVPLQEVVSIVRSQAVVRNIGIDGPRDADLPSLSTSVAGALRCVESLHRALHDIPAGGRLALRVERGTTGVSLVPDRNADLHVHPATRSPGPRF